MNREMRERGEYVRSHMPQSLVNQTGGNSTRDNLSELSLLSAANISEKSESTSELIRNERKNENDDRRSDSDVDSDDIDA